MLLCGFPALHFRAADRRCQPAPGLPCALLDLGAERRSKARANAPRGCEAVSASNASWKSAAAASYSVIGSAAKETCRRAPAASSSVIASAPKQSSLPPRRDSALLRYARNDDVERTDARLHSHAPDAAQRPCGALQIRGPSLRAIRVAPGSRFCAATQERCSAPGTREARSPPYNVCNNLSAA